MSYQLYDAVGLRTRVCILSATTRHPPKRIKRPFAQDAFQNLKDGRPAPIAGTQEQDPGMRPGLVPSNIGKAQVHGDEELSFARNMLPDNRISLSGKALIMHSACLMTCLLTAA